MKILQNTNSDFGFNILNSHHFYVLDKVSDLLFGFLLKQFLKSVWSKIVKESLSVIFQCFLISSNMKVNSNIQTNANVILGWRIKNWTIEPNRVP